MQRRLLNGRASSYSGVRAATVITFCQGRARSPQIHACLDLQVCLIRAAAPELLIDDRSSPFIRSGRRRKAATTRMPLVPTGIISKPPDAQTRPKDVWIPYDVRIPGYQNVAVNQTQKWWQNREAAPGVRSLQPRAFDLRQDPTCKVVSDGLTCFGAFAQAGCAHHRIEQYQCCHRWDIQDHVYCNHKIPEESA
jgi:hypothetical protein